MYGLIHKAIRDCVRQEFGPETWEKIEQRAGADHSRFTSMQAYPDEVTIGEEFLKEVEESSDETGSSGKTDKLSAWLQYALALLGSNEFTYID